MPADHREHEEVTDRIGDGDGPAVSQPHSTCTPGGMSFMIGEYRCCCIAAGMPKMKIATATAT